MALGEELSLLMVEKLEVPSALLLGSRQQGEPKPLTHSKPSFSVKTLLSHSRKKNFGPTTTKKESPECYLTLVLQKIRA